MDSPKYRQILDLLTSEIQAGKWAVGQKMPSEAALVRRLGGSRITIGRALRELTQQGLVRRVAGSGTFVASAGESRKVFGLLIPRLGETDIYEPMCQGMATANPLLWEEVDAGNAEERARDLCRQYADGTVAGVFFAPLELMERKDTVNANVLSLLDHAGVPVVLLDHDALPFPGRSKHDLIGVDNRHAAYLATTHLATLGSKRIGFIGLTGAAPTVDARIAGYREGVGNAGTVVQISSISPDALQNIMNAEPCDAFVCANDRTAGEVMHALRHIGFDIPGAVRIVGMDDVGYAALLPVPLTTIRQPCREIGEAAMSAMLQRIDRPGMPPRDILLACRLVVRKSCGAC